MVNSKCIVCVIRNFYAKKEPSVIRKFWYTLDPIEKIAISVGGIVISASTWGFYKSTTYN